MHDKKTLAFNISIEYFIIKSKSLIMTTKSKYYVLQYSMEFSKFTIYIKH